MTPTPGSRPGSSGFDLTSFQDLASVEGMGEKVPLPAEPRSGQQIEATSCGHRPRRIDHRFQGASLSGGVQRRCQVRSGRTQQGAQGVEAWQGSESQVGHPPQLKPNGASLHPRRIRKAKRVTPCESASTEFLGGTPHTWGLCCTLRLRTGRHSDEADRFIGMLRPVA